MVKRRHVSKEHIECISVNAGSSNACKNRITSEIVFSSEKCLNIQISEYSLVGN